MQSHPMPHGNKKESDLLATWENVTDYMHNLVPAREGSFVSLVLGQLAFCDFTSIKRQI